jgi:uncharacterized protein YqeY
MKTQERIQKDFITAMKAKDLNAKAALSSVKAKITEAEKANGNQPIDESQVLKIITSSIKQRKQSIEAFQLAGREDLLSKETAELAVLESYLPKQMTKEEIENVARVLIQSFPEISTNRNALIGKTMGAFNKQYQGQADPQTVKVVIESLV